MRILLTVLMSALVLSTLPGCGMYNAFQTRDESVTAAWASVQTAYKKRADLIGNLVNTVSGYATHEKDVLTQVTEARAKVGQLNINVKDATPEQLAQYAEAQKALSSGLGKLMVVAEAYPQLKANENFLALQKDLKDVEMQVGAARNRYIREVQAYNVNVRSFPSNLIASFFGYTVKPQLQFDDADAIKNAPKVQFGGSK